jgi:hypothetical protein
MVEHDLPSIELEAGHLRQYDADVLPALEHLAKRRRDLGRRERARRDLIGERLEEVEGLPVDERHVDRGAPELADRLEPAEAAADDDDALASGLVRGQRVSRRR